MEILLLIWMVLSSRVELVVEFSLLSLGSSGFLWWLWAVGGGWVSSVCGWVSGGSCACVAPINAQKCVEGADFSLSHETF